LQRVVTLLEATEMGVIQCESAEAAVRVLEKMGGAVSMMFTDVSLAGRIDGVELAHFTTRRYHLGPCADQKPTRRGGVHAKAMAPARLAARG
jgi:DNA-binding LytR/AlgR family response regulator